MRRDDGLSYKMKLVGDAGGLGPANADAPTLRLAAAGQRTGSYGRAGDFLGWVGSLPSPLQPHVHFAAKQFSISRLDSRATWSNYPGGNDEERGRHFERGLRGVSVHSI